MQTQEQIERESEKLRRELCESDLWSFCGQAWQVLEPSRPWHGTWYRQAIAEHLQAAWRGDFRRLIITVPPQTGKSSLVTKLFPIWAWISEPNTRLLFASYSFEALAVPMSVDRRRVIESDWYQQRWGTRFHLSADDNLKWRFSNDKGGHMLVLTGATGLGGDVLLVDDLHSAEEALSDADRTNAVTRFRKALMSRLTPGGRDIAIIVCQRLHELDVAGTMLREGGWVHLNLPAIAEQHHSVALPLSNEYKVRKPGDLLDTETLNKKYLDSRMIELGADGFSGQYQQEPAPAGGIIFKTEWWKRYEGAAPHSDVIVISVDAAFKANRDAVAVHAWGFQGPNAYLLGWTTEPRGYVATKDVIRAMAHKYRPNAILIEEAANGAAIVEELGKEFPVIPIPVKDSKESRAQACAPQVQAGCVSVPAGSLGDRFIVDCAKFPKGANDHDVDAFTLAINWRRSNSLWVIDYYREKAAAMPKAETETRRAQVDQFETYGRVALGARNRRPILTCECGASQWTVTHFWDHAERKCRTCGQVKVDDAKKDSGVAAKAETPQTSVRVN